MKQIKGNTDILGNTFVCLAFCCFLLDIFIADVSYNGFYSDTFITLIFIILIVLAVVFSMLYLSKAFKNKKSFKLLITTIIFNFVVAVVAILTSMLIIRSFKILCWATAGGCIGANIAAFMHLMNVNKEEKVAKAVNNNIQQVAPKKESIEDKIVKLNLMKEQGIIDEEEYNELKKKYISEML